MENRNTPQTMVTQHNSIFALTHWARTALGLAALCLTVGSASAQSYCSVGASSPGDAGITQVTFNTISNSSTSNPAYSDYTAQSTTVLKGSTYALSVSINAQGSFFGSKTNTAVAWIDWNQNGTFEGSEQYALGTRNWVAFGSNTGLTSASPLNIVIPASAATGPTRMRIRMRFGSTPSACGNINDSEAEDYTIDVVAATTCSGTPNPGNTTVSDATPCPGNSVTLDFQNHSTDLGLSYQWQSSTTGAGGPFANNGLGAATTQVATPSVATWYRVNMTCSGNTGYSTPVLVTPTLSGACYCAPSASSDDNTGLTNVTFNTINNSSVGAPAYTNFSSQSTTVDQGSTHALSVRVNTDGNYTVHVKAWFDWNQNGVFDASEEYNLGSGTNVTDAAPSGSPISILVPATALPGTTVMRVRARYNLAATACGNNTFSEAEDYTVNVVVPPPCTGTPAPGNTTVTNATPCPGADFTLGVQNATSGAGLSYQWQSSTTGAGGPFANNGLGTATTQVANTTVPTWYQLVVTCSGSPGYSYPVEVTPSALTAACYCAATATSNDATGVTNVTFNTISNTSTGNPAYSDFSAQSTTVHGGQSYALSVSVNVPNWFSTVYVNAWIDWNQNGTFEASEAYDLGNLESGFGTAAGPSSGSPLNITVPLSALGGPTIMRVRAGNGSAPAACGNMNNSEAEDYTLNVQVQVPCSGAPYLGNTTASLTAPCPGTDFTLGFEYPVITSGVTYQWQSSTAGPGGPFADNGLGTASTQVTNTAVPTWYQVVATCSGNSGTSYPVAITPSALAAACYCAATATSDDATGVTNVSFGSISNASTGDPAYSDFSAQSTTVEAGQSYTLSVSANSLGWFNSVYVRAWIDWNRNGVFDGTESYSLGTVNSGLGGANGPSSSSPFTITVPANAPGGQTIMRVRASNSSYPAACGNVNNSEAEDYTINVIPVHNTCATAYAVTCGETYPGRTTGVAHSMPATACPFNGAASTGGQNWWKYVATADEAITLSTCGTTSFDSRISVFGGTDCNSMSCVAMSDDNLGCANGSSVVNFNAQTGQTYWFAVHGAGAEEGTYQLSVNCAPICPPPANDGCASAVALANALADGTGTPAQFTNACAIVDAPTPLSGNLPVQGVWFSFNSGAYDHALITLQDNEENAANTATTLNYALFAGTCSGMGADLNEADVLDAGGRNIADVIPNTDYLLLVYNTGGSGVEGTFGLMVEHAAHDDAAITAILDPAPGLYCSSVLAPQVTLLNNGDNDLTSVQITYGLSGGASHTYNWTGNLTYGASTTFTLPTVAAEAGLGQTLTVATSLPNGVADGLPANDSQSVALDVGGEGVVVNIMTDNDPSQLTWVIYDEFYIPAAQGGPYAQANTLISENHCLSIDNGNCFMFQITDGFGDGLCCANGNGYWELRTPTGGLLLRDLFDANVDGYSTPTSPTAHPNYGFGHNICLPAGPANIAPTECGLFNNQLGNKVYANKVTGASNYQFEFSDPDAGFMRRIARPYNYVHFWDIVTNPLVPGVKYFARVRTDRDGPMANAHFGTGCEMGLSLPAVVTCTQLIQAPAYGHSCNETRTFNTNNSFIYAQPVQGATEYQFRITNGGEGYDQTFTRSTYILQLKWNPSVAPLLQDGYTYAVQMNVKVNGLYSGFCASTCNITIVPDGNRPEASMVQAMGAATLWPNPVRDGQVNLNMDGLKDADQDISVVIQNIDGKQVFAKEFGNSGEHFNTTLNLPSDIASGVYMVNITVNGERTVQRLSIVR
ncbi:MAG: GEVED domain-containing protein [Flavobacteriales bacterium]